MSPAALISLAKHLGTRPLNRTAETGTGASTLIFSQLSRDHTVFTLDTDGSMSAVQTSPILRRQTTRFIEGPTQRTLPEYVFQSKLQAVLIDGPHAYPFPDLEYFYFYPQIETGGLLVIDDIHIPSIHNLYRFLRKEAMFELLEVRHTTAFFGRTAIPALEPRGDGWWTQGFNKRVLLRYSWQDNLRRLIPERWRPWLRRYSDRLRLRE